jgi:hypothetical protein
MLSHRLLGPPFAALAAACVVGFFGMGCEPGSTLLVTPPSASFSKVEVREFVISVDGDAEPTIYEENLSDGAHFQFASGSESCLEKISKTHSCTEKIKLYSYASGLKADFEVVPKTGNPKHVTLTTP